MNNNNDNDESRAYTYNPPPQPGMDYNAQYAPGAVNNAPPQPGIEYNAQYTPGAAINATPPQPGIEYNAQYAPGAANSVPPPQPGMEYNAQYAPGAANSVPPPQPGMEYSAQYAPGAPADRVEAQEPVGGPRVTQAFSARVRENQGERTYIPSEQNWCEPAYSAPQETPPNMYTPGIVANQPYSHKRAEKTEQEHKIREHKGGFGRFIRAACLVLVCVILCGAATYGVIEYRINRGDFSPSVNQVVLGGASSSTQPNRQPGGNVTSPVSTSGANMSAEEIYGIACKQVVDIRTEAPMNSGGMFDPQSTSMTTAVSGSGFIISSDGYILTNFHVVETAYDNSLPLKVSLNDGTTYDATVVGYDVSNDVALIKIDATDLSAAVIANSDDTKVGQRIYAVGNPFGDLNYTMTEGIVSALERVVSVDGKSIDTFQFDAAVNPGNSGGPVYNTNGEVIGIVSVKIMGNSVEGIGFAIPINDAIVIASELIQNGYITGRPLIGITVETVTSAHADYYGWVVGAYIKSISQNSAAEKTGLKVGDIITALGDDSVTTSDELVYTLRKFHAGDTTTITVWRAGEQLTLPITFDENLTAGQPQ